MSEALIKSLQDRIDSLGSENASLKAENKSRRIKGKSVNSEHDKLKELVKTLTEERDSLKSKIESEPSELQATIDNLQATLRNRDHKDAFSSVKEFDGKGKDGKPVKYKLSDGVSPDAIWKLTGYKADGETPDARVVAEKYGEALQTHPYLFSEVTPIGAGSPTRPTTVTPRESGPGAGKPSSLTLSGSGQNGQGNAYSDVPGRI